MWTSERMNMGPHLIYTNYIALWLRFPIRHDVYILSHFLSFIDAITCEALLVYISWLAKSTVSCHVKVILSSNTSFYTWSFISEEVLKGHSSFSWVYNWPAPLNADKIKITPWFIYNSSLQRHLVQRVTVKELFSLRPFLSISSKALNPNAWCRKWVWGELPPC